MAKTIIVTGASRGIGLAIAKFLIKEGHNVVVTARSKDALQQLQKQAPERVKAVAGDMADPSIAGNVTQQAIDSFGAIDGLIINHGVIAPMERIHNTNITEWKHLFDVNFFAAIAFIEAALPSLKKASKGRIVFTSSGAAEHSYSGWGAYCASKAALRSLGDTLAVEEKDIVSVSVKPGVVDTDMQQDLRGKHLSVMNEAEQKKFTSLAAEGKLLKPEQPGHVIARLALDAHQELSGKLLSWDAEELASYRDG